MARELEFERPVLEIERQLEELRRLAVGRDGLANVVAIDDGGPRKARDTKQLHRQIQKLEERAQKLKVQIFSRLSRWQIVQVARHPERPFTLDYVQALFTDFVELHGDRRFAEDPAIVAGLARFRGVPVMVMGHQKGRSTRENMERNFGMPRPEGYRKASRLARMADQFGLPILSFIDTPGAYPGLGAEERGQAQAIAEALETFAQLKVPVIATVIGEGGSGGALAIGVANRILVLEFGIYSVISPEGCASILFKDAAHAERAADALKLTAPDLRSLGVVDEVVPEPAGGAHRDPAKAAELLSDALWAQLSTLRRNGPEALRDDRYRRFRTLGAFEGESMLLQSLMARANGAETPPGEELDAPTTADILAEGATADPPPEPES